MKEAGGGKEVVDMKKRIERYLIENSVNYQPALVL